MLERIDIYPTHRHGDYLLRAGNPFPYGATLVPGGVNFAVFSRHATACALVLYERGAAKPMVEIPFDDAFRIGHVFAMIVFGLDHEKLEYGYRFDGPYQPQRGHRFDGRKVLLDPYARAVSGRDVWGKPPDLGNGYQHRALIARDDFDWVSDRPLEIPAEDLVLYEMHVRGFTRHPSSGVKYPGTFAALHEKIDYLKTLGINAVELMPIHEFDEFDNERVNPQTGEPLLNYWGYSPVNFFAPKTGYAATGSQGLQVDEFKAAVKAFHQQGIEVFLDVVFNHTGEGDEEGPTFSYRGIDNRTYYMLRPDGAYYNFSGCGNTMNCNDPIVRRMVLDCLRYWVSEYHIDGFRFDLASILGRDRDGRPLLNPPLIEEVAFDAVLGKSKLIAEAWDAGGLYQVGTFPSYRRWTEWNGKYRDTIRRFLRGDMGQLWEMARRIEGSPDLYPERGPTASVNFVTCHDGFTLNDLFSYDQKHNENNGEENRDGANDNYSWNCGWEGPSEDRAINRLRRRLKKNAIAILMVSQGMPLLSMGDEIGHTKWGNNNTYCHDNELNWFDWRRVEDDDGWLRFVRRCIAFRHAHPALRRRTHFAHEDVVGSGYPDISWHGVRAWHPDWAHHARTFAFMLCGQHAKGGEARDDNIYVAMNMHWEGHLFELPQLPPGRIWRQFANTALPAPHDIREPGTEIPLQRQRELYVAPRTVVILVGR